MANIKPGTYAFTLLTSFKTAGAKGFTAEEAAVDASLEHTGYWKRVSDLLRAGFLRKTSKTRLGVSERPQAVLVITPEGRAHIKATRTRRVAA